MEKSRPSGRLFLNPIIVLKCLYKASRTLQATVRQLFHPAAPGRRKYLHRGGKPGRLHPGGMSRQSRVPWPENGPKPPCARLKRSERPSPSFTAWCVVLTSPQLPEVSLAASVPKEKPFLTPDQTRVFVAAVKGTRNAVPTLLPFLLCRSLRPRLCGKRMSRTILLSSGCRAR